MKQQHKFLFLTTIVSATIVAFGVFLTNCSWFFNGFDIRLNKYDLLKNGDQIIIDLINKKKNSDYNVVSVKYELDSEAQKLKSEGKITIDVVKEKNILQKLLITAISSDILDEVEFNITFSGKDMGKNVKSPIYLTYGTSGQLNDYNRYIADITYSFYNGEGHTGTAWILSRIGDTGYNYYFATNEHVTELMTINVASSTCQLNFDARGAWSWDSQNSYVVKTGFTVTKQPTDTFFTGTRGIDLSILKISFTPTVVTNTYPMLGQRLDRYNAGGSRYASDQLISSQNASKIAANTTKVFKGIKSCTPEKPWYIGGYPSLYNVSPNQFSWETHKINRVSIGSGAHECWDEDSGNDPTGLYTDNSEQYIVSTKSSATWMYKGASGSPVLNTDFQVVGIYWGGFGPKDGTTFNPCISAFSWVWTWNSNENEKYLRT